MFSEVTAVPQRGIKGKGNKGRQAKYKVRRQVSKVSVKGKAQNQSLAGNKAC